MASEASAALRAGDARRSAGRSTRTALALVLFGLLLFALAAAPALAGTKKTHIFSSSFDGTGPGPVGSLLSGPAEVAVDEASGDVYVLDNGSNSPDLIKKFSAAGVPKAFTAEELSPGTTFLDGSNSGTGPFSGNLISIVVDNSGGATQGNIYVIESTFLAGGRGLFAFDSTGKFLWQKNDVNLGGNNIYYAAVDSTGSLWVQVAGSWRKFNAQGVFQSVSVTPVTKNTFSFGAVSEAGARFAIAPTGDFYSIERKINNVPGSESGLYKYDSTGKRVATLAFGVYRGLAVDKTSGEVYANDGDKVQVFDSTGNQIDDFNPPESGSGLALNGSSGAVYVPSSGAEKLVHIMDSTIVTVPDVTIATSTDVTQTGATLNGTLNPAGASSEWRFEYRKSGSGAAWTQTPTETGGSGTSTEPVDAPISGLEYGTPYEIRLVGINAENSKSAIAASTFMTAPIAPIVETLAAAPRTTTTARLNARIDPSGASTEYHFEYGTDASYGTSVPATQDGDAGSVRGAVLRGEEIWGLEPGSTYHYRVVTSNSAGTTTGEDRTFTTRTLAEATPPARGVELVNQPDKGNQNVFVSSQTILSSVNSLEKPLDAAGETFFWQLFGGAPGGSTGTAAPFRSVRTPTGWTSQSLVPPAAEQIGGGSLAYNLLGMSTDFKDRLFYVSEGVLSGAESYLVRVGEDGDQDILIDIPGGLGNSPYNIIEATDDLAHVIVQPEWEEGPTHVYDYGSSPPELLDVMPNGSPSCGLSGGSLFEYPGAYDATHLDFGTFHYIATDDASLVYFGTTNQSCTGEPQLYLRDRDAEETIRISAPAVSGPLEEVRFLRASADGEVAIYSTATKLVAEDSNEGTDLYRHTLGEGNECLTCEVPNGDARVGKTFVSKDFSHVYFISKEQLIPGKGTDGISNLYVWSGGEVEYVADGTERFQDLALFAATRLSDDGNVLLFPSRASLTTDAVGDCGKDRCTQLYRYDDRDGSLECVSCRRGAVTQSEVNSEATSAYLTYFMSDDGSTAAFATATPLVPKDVNQATDVYEWRNGAVRLITDGVTEFPKGFGSPTPVGVDADGSDVFFTVASPITGFEQDKVANLYDARVGGGFTPATPPAHCTEDACQGPLDPEPRLDAPASSSFTGPGNETTQKKAQRKKAKLKKRKAQKRKAQKRKAKTRAKAKARQKARQAARKGGRNDG